MQPGKESSDGLIHPAPSSPVGIWEMLCMFLTTCFSNICPMDAMLFSIVMTCRHSMRIYELRAVWGGLIRVASASPSVMAVVVCVMVQGYALHLGNARVLHCGPGCFIRTGAGRALGYNTPPQKPRRC